MRCLLWVNSDMSDFKIIRLSNESTNDCPCGCGNPAYMYTTDGLDGYVDAASQCAREAIEAALKEQE